MANEEVIKDFGQITCPTKWEDVTLKKFQAIEAFYEDKGKDVDIREIVHIMIDKDIDYVNELPVEWLELLLEKLAFLQKSPEIKEPSNKITIDGEVYMVNFMEKLKTGEFVAFDSVLKSDKHNYAAMLAILCRKEGEIYDSKFEAEVFDKRVELFEKQPVINILPITTFFLTLWVTLGKHSQLFSQVEEGINHILSSIENSQKIGAFKKWYLKWRMKKYLKYLKSINNTSQTSSRSLRTLFKKGKWKKKK